MKRKCFGCRYRDLDKEFNYESIKCKLKRCIHFNIENSLNEELDKRKKWVNKFNGTRWL